MDTDKFIELLKADDTKALDNLYIKDDLKEIDFKAVYDNVCDLDNGSVNNIIGYIHCQGTLGEKDYKEALKYWKLSAKQGNSMGQHNLGKEYMDGDKCVSRNSEKALKYLEASAKQENAYAYYSLFFFYAHPIRITHDYEKSEMYLKLAADSGLKDAQYYLGREYEDGGNLDAAFKYHKLAAKQGHLAANCKVGSMYQHDWYETKNNKLKALKYFKFCAENKYQEWRYRELKEELGDIPDYVDNLEKVNKEQKEEIGKMRLEIEQLRAENTELKYRPPTEGGMGYMEAKADFESQI